MTRYEPADSFGTPRFSGVRTFMRLPNYGDLENADAAIVGALFVPILGALFWRRATGPGALVSMLVGGVVVIVLMATQGLFANSPIYVGLLASLFFFVVVSLLTSRGSEDDALAWERRMTGQNTT